MNHDDIPPPDVMAALEALASRLEQAERTLAAVRLVHRDCTAETCATCAAIAAMQNPTQPQEKK